MRLFGLLFGAALGFVAASCGGNSKPCATTCTTGCCDAMGKCQAGTDPMACGSDGFTCETCQLGQRCSFGTCVTLGGSGGGTSSVGGGNGTGGGVATGGGSATGGGHATGGGTGTGGGVGTGGGSSTGGGTGTGGGGAVCNSANCAGCCSQGMCYQGTSDTECGAGGISCLFCQNGDVCQSGGCVNPNATHTGSPCTAASDCPNGKNGQAGMCSTAWPGGYCYTGCTTTADCPDGGVCGGTACYATCSTPAAGQGECRADYVCDYNGRADGGGPNVCRPDCRSDSTYCTGLSLQCRSDGYCR